ncbi:putative RUN domain-containing protein 1 [Homarus americanus]|uniref:Putative RUN domain-containing protein 1 n=1 Tax=Homarus americanus TaxID=6706 RepID=A0A8J5K158_HOMAM|nr:putative RUN domain-containing protein 1 [Homarus americanus]
MSISDPLIKELKGHILEATKASCNGAILDTQSFILPLCQVLEAIFRKGLINAVHSAFGLTKRDYWSWVEKTSQTSTGLQGSFKSTVEAVTNNQCVATPQGRGRLFIRHALKSKCLHIPVETIVRLRCNDGIYDEESIIGNEILGEIFLSLLYQCSHIDFDLKLENASFLDETWQLPIYQEYELVPCMDLGVFLGHVNGRAVVVKVEEGSVAAEDVSHLQSSLLILAYHRSRSLSPWLIVIYQFWSISLYFINNTFLVFCSLQIIQQMTFEIPPFCPQLNSPWYSPPCLGSVKSRGTMSFWICLNCCMNSYLHNETNVDMMFFKSQQITRCARTKLAVYLPDLNL